jgi:hypothetical protein
MQGQVPEVINFSGLKLFRQCPNLYKERYIDGTYTPEQKDYFLYGSLVDAMLTDPTNVDNRFVMVSRKKDVSPLELASKKNELEQEISGLLEKANAGNKTAQKGINSRQTKIAEIDEQLADVNENESREQVTPSMWHDASETAEAIADLDLWKRLTKAAHIFQPSLESTSLKRRGTLDVLSGSAPVIQLYRLCFVEKTIAYEEFRKAVNELPEADRWLVIADAKTTKDLKEFNAQKVSEMYAGQLSYYRSLVRDIFGIEPACVIIAADKANGFKMAQEYLFEASTLDWADNATKAIEEAFWRCAATGEWPAAKEISGSAQECFTCSKCRVRPHSKTDLPCLV